MRPRERERLLSAGTQSPPGSAIALAELDHAQCLQVRVSLLAQCVRIDLVDLELRQIRNDNYFSPAWGGLIVAGGGRCASRFNVA